MVWRSRDIFYMCDGVDKMSNELYNLIETTSSEYELDTIMQVLEEDLIINIIAEELYKSSVNVSDRELYGIIDSALHFYREGTDLYRIKMADTQHIPRQTPFYVIDWLHYWFGNLDDKSDIKQAGIFFIRGDAYIEGLGNYVDNFTRNQESRLMQLKEESEDFLSKLEEFKEANRSEELQEFINTVAQRYVLVKDETTGDARFIKKHDAYGLNVDEADEIALYSTLNRDVIAEFDKLTKESSRKQVKLAIEVIWGEIHKMLEQLYMDAPYDTSQLSSVARDKKSKSVKEVIEGLDALKRRCEEAYKDHKEKLSDVQNYIKSHGGSIDALKMKENNLKKNLNGLRIVKRQWEDELYALQDYKGRIDKVLSDESYATNYDLYREFNVDVGKPEELKEKLQAAQMRYEASIKEAQGMLEQAGAEIKRIEVSKKSIENSILYIAEYEQLEKRIKYDVNFFNRKYKSYERRFNSVYNRLSVFLNAYAILTSGDYTLDDDETLQKRLFDAKQILGMEKESAARSYEGPISSEYLKRKLSLDIPETVEKEKEKFISIEELSDEDRKALKQTIIQGLEQYKEERKNLIKFYEDILKILQGQLGTLSNKYEEAKKNIQEAISELRKLGMELPEYALNKERDTEKSEKTEKDKSLEELEEARLKSYEVLNNLSKNITKDIEFVKNVHDSIEKLGEGSGEKYKDFISFLKSSYKGVLSKGNQESFLYELSNVVQLLLRHITFFSPSGHNKKYLEYLVENSKLSPDDIGLTIHTMNNLVDELLKFGSDIFNTEGVLIDIDGVKDQLKMFYENVKESYAEGMTFGVKLDTIKNTIKSLEKLEGYLKKYDIRTLENKKKSIEYVKRAIDHIIESSFIDIRKLVKLLGTTKRKFKHDDRTGLLDRAEYIGAVGGVLRNVPSLRWVLDTPEMTELRELLYVAISVNDTTIKNAAQSLVIDPLKTLNSTMNQTLQRLRDTGKVFNEKFFGTSTDNVDEKGQIPSVYRHTIKNIMFPQRKRLSVLRSSVFEEDPSVLISRTASGDIKSMNWYSMIQAWKGEVLQCLRSINRSLHNADGMYAAKLSEFSPAIMAKESPNRLQDMYNDISIRESKGEFDEFDKMYADFYSDELMRIMNRINTGRGLDRLDSDVIKDVNAVYDESLDRTKEKQIETLKGYLGNKINYIQGKINIDKRNKKKLTKEIFLDPKNWIKIKKKYKIEGVSATGKVDPQFVSKIKENDPKLYNQYVHNFEEKYNYKFLTEEDRKNLLKARDLLWEYFFKMKFLPKKDIEDRDIREAEYLLKIVQQPNIEEMWRSYIATAVSTYSDATDVLTGDFDSSVLDVEDIEKINALNILKGLQQHKDDTETSGSNKLIDIERRIEVYRKQIRDKLKNYFKDLNGIRDKLEKTKRLNKMLTPEQEYELDQCDKYIKVMKLLEERYIAARILDILRNPSDSLVLDRELSVVDLVEEFEVFYTKTKAMLHILLKDKFGK